MKQLLKRVLPSSFVKTIQKYRQDRFKYQKLKRYIENIGINQFLFIVDLIEEKYGHFNSAKANQPIDGEEKPIPWYTYPAIEYLKQLDLKNREVFEFGSGNSSLFWAKKAKKVYSVEHSLDWYRLVCNNRLPNQEIIFADRQVDYVNSILNTNKNFYVIVIDGKYRFQCAKIALNCLNNDGFIILDNSEKYSKTAKLLTTSNLIPIDFFGLGPINYYCWTTSIYLQRTVEIKTESNRQPNYGIGSLCEDAESHIDF